MAAALETISCPFCDLAGTDTLQEDGWTAKQCPECRLLFISPRPAPDAMIQLYVEDGAHAPACAHIGTVESAARTLQARQVLRLLRQRKPGRLLEIGPGAGSLLAAARSAGWEVGGVELNPIQAAFISDSLRIPCWPSLSSVPGTWDVVYHRDVLSHFSDPVSTFRTIARLMPAGGLHLFETGSGDYARKYDKLFPSFQYPDHLFTFSDQSLDELLKRSGFAPVQREEYSIVASLLVEQAVKRAKRMLRRGTAATVEAPGQATLDATRPSIARDALDRVRFAARYRLGALLPKDARPRTMIIQAVALADGRAAEA